MSHSTAMKNFMHAKEYAVIGKVLTDPERFDYKVLKWYQTRNLPVTPIKAGGEGETIEGLKAVGDAKDLPNLSTTGISMIIHPAKGLPILKSLYPEGNKTENGPWGIWLQPGAEDGNIKEWVKESGLEDKVVLGGPCILVSGQAVRDAEGLN